MSILKTNTPKKVPISFQVKDHVVNDLKPSYNYHMFFLPNLSVNVTGFLLTKLNPSFTNRLNIVRWRCMGGFLDQWPSLVPTCPLLANWAFACPWGNTDIFFVMEEKTDIALKRVFQKTLKAHLFHEILILYIIPKFFENLSRRTKHGMLMR